MLLDTVNFSKQKKIKDTLRKNLLEFQKSRKKHLKEDLGKPCILHVLQKKTHTQLHNSENFFIIVRK